jgi:alpha-1,3/alpha-1,6-mannosyltransferase
MIKGGAERLVIDAALGFISKGYEVDIYTSHCDPKHSFRETQDGEEMKVTNYANEPTNSHLLHCCLKYF